MKTHVLVTSFLLLLCFMGACNSSPVMTKATGLAYEVVVVMDKPIWNGEAGQAVKKDLSSEVPGLPQSEPSLKITYAPTPDFNGLLTYVRNIFILDIDSTMYTKVSVNYEANRWASGQVVLTMKAPTEKAAVEYLEAHKKQLVNFFVKEEMNRMIALLQKNYSNLVQDKLKNKFDILLNAPSDMTFYRDTTDFFWTSNNANTGRTDMVVYTFPYTDPNTFTAEYLIAKRDSVLKANVPGAFPNSYMTTDSRFVDYAPITLHGKYCGVLRGLWKMEGDMMGGPFVSHIRLDEKNNRVVVVEGFVYAPETNKRNFIRKAEAALYTLRLPGEFDEDLMEPLGVKEANK